MFYAYGHQLINCIIVEKHGCLPGKTATSGCWKEVTAARKRREKIGRDDDPQKEKEIVQQNHALQEKES